MPPERRVRLSASTVESMEQAGTLQGFLAAQGMDMTRPYWSTREDTSEYIVFTQAGPGNEAMRRLSPAEALLLTEAIPPLLAAFGGHGSIRCTTHRALVRVVVELPDTFPGDPDACLRLFDETYWRDHCADSGGRLVFDYEVLL